MVRPRIKNQKPYDKALRRVGLSPGSLVHIGERKATEVKITLIKYDEESYECREVKTIEECLPIKDHKRMTWVNIDGLHRVDIIEKIGNSLGVHPLTMEDILNTGERPKLDEFDDHMFVILKMLYHNKTTNEITAEQVSMVFGKNYVVTFQETIGDVFDQVRERLKGGKGRMRKMGSDYLAFALIDAIVDNYFVVLESIGERMESLEEDAVEAATKQTLQEIHRLRGELLYLRKIIWPLREVINCLQRTESELINDTTKMFFRDVYDHAIQVIDNVETYRDMFSSMLEVYVSSVSNRMNEIMKVLTIIATIFMPLSFIAGMYGTNFVSVMPPYLWEFGFPVVLLLALSVSLVMLTYFRKKKWL